MGQTVAKTVRGPGRFATRDHSMMTPMPPVAVTAYTLTCAAGHGINAVRDALSTRRSGLQAGHWNNSEIGSFVRVRRTPNEYNRRAQSFLNFLSCA